MEQNASRKLKTLSHLPNIPGIAKESRKNLRWKSLTYLLRNDTSKIFSRFFFKHPFLYGVRLLRSYLSKKAYTREDDFFYYGLKDRGALESALKKPNALAVVGFSYCHKPFECPSGRFTDGCLNDPNHFACQQCFIGEAKRKLPPSTPTYLIPTVHYIGEKLFELQEAHPGKELVFLITACELTLEMFGDWGKMLGIRGVGIRLDGRICNTMKAFELSERGIKPGLTVVRDETQKQILEWIELIRQRENG